MPKETTIPATKRQTDYQQNKVANTVGTDKIKHTQADMLEAKQATTAFFEETPQIETPAAQVQPQPAPQPVAGLGESNALSKAHAYLQYSAFSKKGLLEQLLFEGFTQPEAQYAVDNCGADWSAQALEKAGQYLAYSSFSYKGLIEQLEFEGFTTQEAEYGVSNCGADWMSQAAAQAKSYLAYSSFSQQELYDQLLFEGFTAEQAQYGVSAVGY